MITGIVLTLATTVAFACANIVDARLSAFLKPLPALLFYAGTVNLALLAAVLALYGMPQVLPPDLFGCVAVFGILNSLYLVPYYWALRTTDTSVVVALFPLGGILVPVLAFFVLGETLTATQISGFALVISASIALNLKIGKQFRMNVGFWLMLLSSAMTSTAMVFYKKVLSGADMASAMFWGYVFTLVFSTGTILFPPFFKKIKEYAPVVRQQWRVFAAVAAFSLSAALLKAAALAALPVVYYRALSATQSSFVLIISLISAKFFGREMHEVMTGRVVLKKIVCFSLIVTGICLTLRAP